MVVHNQNKFYYLDGYTDETAYEYINSKHKLEIPTKFLTEITELIYAQYPYIKKAHVAIILKAYFEEFRKALLTNNVVKIDGSVQYMFIGYKKINNKHAKYCMVTKSGIVDSLKITNRRRNVLTNKNPYHAPSHKRYWRKNNPKKVKKNKTYWKKQYANYKRREKYKKKILKQALWGLAVLKRMVRRHFYVPCY